MSTAAVDLSKERIGLRRSLRGIGALMAISYRTAPGLAIGAFVLGPLGSAQGQLMALVMKHLADAVFAQDRDRATTMAIATSAIAGVAFAAMIGGGKLRLTLTERAGFALDQRLAELVAGLPGLEHMERPDYLDKLELLREQRGMLGQAVNALLANLAVWVQLAFTIVLLIRLSPWLLLLPVAAVPGMVVIPRQQKRMRALEEQNAPSQRMLQSLFVLATTPGPGKEVRVFNVEDDIERRYEATWREAFQRQWRMRVRIEAENALAFAFPTLAVVAAIGFVALRAVDGAATPGDVLLASTLAGQAVGLLGNSISSLNWLMMMLRAVGRYLWLEDYFKRVTDPRRPLEAVPDRLRSGIRLAGVTFRYPGTDSDVLTDVTVDLPAGSVVALVGENGAGKTTFTKLLCRFYDPTAGTITVDGADLSAIPHDQWRERLAAGFQDFGRFEFLVRETVGVGDLPRLDDRDAVAVALDRAGAGELTRDIEGGLDAQLGRQWDGGVELSGGQWQKLALGRALMRDEPLLLVLDEPTSALDAETEHALFERFASASRSVANGGITVLVSHRFSTVRMADVIVVLDDGRVREVGSHAELMARPDLYAELYEMQARSYR